MTSPTMRELLGSWIEQAIDLLNAIDGDAEAEDDGTLEPSLGIGMKQTPKGLLFLCNDLEDPQCAPKRARRRPARLPIIDIREVSA